MARSDVDPDTFLQFCSKASKVIDDSGVKTPDKVHWLLANFYDHRKEAEKAQIEWEKTGFPKESEWLVIGPFDNANDKGRIMEYPPETEMNPSAICEGKSGKVKWQKANDGNMDRLVDFYTVFMPNEWVLAYALTDVISPDDRKAQLLIGSDDGVKVWLNNKTIWTNQVPRGLQLDQDVVPVELKKGNNRILLKVDQGTGGWGFTFRITDENGQPFEDLRYVSADTQ